MNIKNQLTTCDNCGQEIRLTPLTLKDETVEIDEKKLYVIYTECSVCGERSLKQIDNYESYKLRTPVVKLKLMQRKGRKLSEKQKKRLFKLNKQLDNIRKTLNTLYWDEVYRLLNK